MSSQAWQIFGLLSDIAGALFLFISTEKLNKIVVHLIEHYQRNNTEEIDGYPQPKFKYELLPKFAAEKNVSNFFSKLGLFLLVLGFLLQLISSLTSNIS